MEKVYLVDIDNGLEYADAEHKVEGVFEEFEKAVKFLLGKGFYPCTNRYQGEEESFFLKPKPQDSSVDNDFKAKIIEMYVR